MAQTKLTRLQVAAGTLTDVEIAAANKDGAAGTASMRTLGTGAQQAAAGNDSRLSDSRTPTGSASGDLSATYPGPTVAKIQNIPVTLTSITTNDILKYNGTAWVNTPIPGGGTVTSVGLAAITNLTSVTGSPVTGSGTLTQTLLTQNQNLVFAGPTTGAAATPTFRSLVTADFPASGVTGGTYTSVTFAVDSTGRITSVSGGKVYREVPTGTINGVNATFTLANTPIAGTEQVHLNGIYQYPGAGNDYTISGATITMLNVPQTGDRLVVDYQR